MVKVYFAITVPVSLSGTLYLARTADRHRCGVLGSTPGRVSRERTRLRSIGSRRKVIYSKFAVSIATFSVLVATDRHGCRRSGFDSRSSRPRTDVAVFLRSTKEGNSVA